MNTEKKCQHCNEPIKGRSDKKFCDDNCRSTHYNTQKTKENTSLIKQTNHILKKNRQILQTLNPSGMIKVKRKDLLTKGFDFTYFTGIYTTKKGSTYYFCYEMGYLSLKNDEVLLVKKKEFPRQKG